MSKVRKNAVHNILREKILEELRDMEANTKLPTEFEIARQYKVSRLTINRVLSRLVSEGILERRMGIGTFVTTKEKRIELLEMRAKAGTIIIAYPNFFSYRIWSLQNLMESAVFASKMNSINFHLSNEGQIAMLAKEAAATPAIKGIFIIPPRSKLGKDALSTLDSIGVPVVVADPVQSDVFLRRVHAVHVDYHDAGYKQMKFLLSKGLRSNALVTCEPSHPGQRTFIEGVKKALYEADLLYCDLLRRQREPEFNQSSMEVSSDITLKLMKKPNPPQGILFDSFLAAMGGVHALMKVKPDCSQWPYIIADDRMMGVESFLGPKFLAMSYNYRDMVDSALEIFSGKRRNARVHLIKGKLTSPARCNP